MKAATAAQIKAALKDKSASELMELTLRLARFKKENKELRQKISVLKGQLSSQEKHSQETLDKLYHLKDEEKRGLSRSSREISKSLKEIKRTSLTEINSL